jgi:hypothetical protein
MKFKDYSADNTNSRTSRVPSPAAKSKADQSLAKVIKQAAHDVDTLFTLDELYTGLSSLVMQAKPDADYSGIRDAERLKQIIDAAVHRLPSAYQATMRSEVNSVQTLLTKHAYSEANLRVMKGAKVVGEHIENLREAPEDVQAVLGHKAHLK